MVGLLIQTGADINAKNIKDETPLYIAIENKKTEIAKVLIDAGANLNTPITERGWTAIHFTTWHGNREVLELLIQADVDLNIQDTDGNSPLHLAIIQKNKDIFALLIQAGANLDIQNKDGETPLYYVISHYDYSSSKNKEYNIKEIVNLLVQAGANPNIPSKNGYTPLSKARHKDYKEIIKQLQQAGAR